MTTHLRRFRPAALFAALLAFVAFTPATRAQIYVAPEGDDTAAGDLNSPLATLPRALERARERWAQVPSSDCILYLRGGTYRLEQTLVLGRQDNPSAGHRLILAAYPGERPVISGGVPLRDWRKLAPGEEPAGLPAAAHGHLWVADLPVEPGVAWRFHALYDGFSSLPRARSQPYLSRTPRASFADHMSHRQSLDFPAGTLKAWPHLADVELFTRPNHNWLVNYLGLVSVDEATGTARTSVPATYTQSGPFWIENIIEALDEPGEWVLNSQENRVYLWPRGDSPGDAMVAPKLTTLIRVAGRADDTGSADQPAAGFRFVGLTFAHTDRDVWQSTDAGLQHDWAMWDKDDACLRFRVAQDCEVENCTFTAAGGHGVRCDLFARNIKLHGNTFSHLGAGGVLFCGYGPGTKDVNGGNEIVDNEFHDLGELWWHAPAIFLWQSGHNLVAHNLIHDLPYNGIVLSGVRPRFYGIDTPEVGPPVYPPDLRENLHLMRWHEIGRPTRAAQVAAFAHTRNNLIRDNEIHDVMRVLQDGNAIYLSAAGLDNEIRRNVIYRVAAPAAIRTDDDQSGTLIEDNVMIGSGLVIKDDNTATNNLLINGTLRILSDRPECRIDRNVFYFSTAPDAFYHYDIGNRYYFADKLAAGEAIVPPRTDRNIFYSPDLPAARKFLAAMQTQWGNDRASLVGDPQLRDPEHGDFSFLPGSPAKALGIHSIDVSRAGRLHDPMTARLHRAGGLDLSHREPPPED